MNCIPRLWTSPYMPHILIDAEGELRVDGKLISKTPSTHVQEALNKYSKSAPPQYNIVLVSAFKTPPNK